MFAALTIRLCEALSSDDPEIHYEAVLAAGAWEIEATWEHRAGAGGRSSNSLKELLLAAIDAVGNIRPKELPGTSG